MAVLIEKLTLNSKLSPRLILTLHGVNITAEIIGPTFLVQFLQPVFGSKLIVTAIISIVWLKLFSYAQTNYWFRLKSAQGKSITDDGKAKLADVVTWAKMYYFIAAPTLCFQFSYPKKLEPFDIKLLLRRVAVFVFLTSIIYIISNQYIYPAVVNSIPYMEDLDYPKIIERVLKTAVPNLIAWLLGFYVFFEVYLNILCDITRFGDCKFYGDWWNAQSLGYYWSSWNLCVHQWMKRHIYRPLQMAGVSKELNFLICFLISAFFHEFVLAVPFGKVKGWAFFGILAQIPLIYITEPWKSHHYVGNIIFWFSIVLGQPFLVLMYYRDWVQSSYIKPVY